MFCMVFQSRARLWTSHPGLAAILPVQQAIYQGPLNHLHPGTECIQVQMLQSCNPFGVISLPCVGVVSQWEGDIDFPTPARALHFYFALEPTDYIAVHEWK